MTKNNRKRQRRQTEEEKRIDMHFRFALLSPLMALLGVFGLVLD